jgi:hypothetical protein
VLSLDVIGEEVAIDPDPFISHSEGAEKPNEQTDHVWIRVGETQLIAILPTLSPIQHAARDV